MSGRKGKVKSISEENGLRTYEITEDTGFENTYYLDEYIKDVWVKNIKVGSDVEFSLNKQDDSFIAFIKLSGASSAPAKKPYTPSRPTYNQAATNDQWKARDEQAKITQERISKQWAVNAAIEVFKLNKDQFPDQQITIDHIRDTSKLLWKLTQEDFSK